MPAAPLSHADPIPPLSAVALAARLAADPRIVANGTRYRIECVAETGSTNRDLLGRGDPGDEPVIRTAELQTTGRGRVGRTWTSPAGAGLTFSVLMSDRDLAVDRLGWVGAVLGLAVVGALDAISPGLPSGLKWPNDVLIGERKCAGVLAERTAGALIVGCGLNVSSTEADLPRPDATSLVLQGVTVDRSELLAEILGQFTELIGRWRAAGGSTADLRPAYLARCVTVSQVVRIDLPGGDSVTGQAVDVDETGRLVVDTGAGDPIAYAAGDVVHARRVGR